MSGLSDDLRNLPPNPDDKPVVIELNEDRPDDPQVMLYNLFDEYMAHYRQALQRLSPERIAANEQAWAEIHRTNLVYWEQAKKNGWQPNQLPGWETAAAMNDIAVNMANLAGEVGDQAAEQDE
ncbi:hypothetical protein [Nocardiopsis tropica]|uniref:Uncharacterized protein n=1 Tax=Nocardiopsis tropica TaxID=109330 RepID=A0ABU7KR93_9ACTN|nr:hypothetical protein [Nocardiopsis umidischolae]MEE2051819.1 hypothetical protein [Nocardiopsis umidischolae]